MSIKKNIFDESEIKYLEGKPLTSNELAFMEGCLDSLDSRRIAIACGALLRDPSANLGQKENARNALRKLVAEATAHAIRLELSITLLLIPYAEIEDVALKRFAYSLANDEIFSVRVNAISVLVRFAQCGDEQAIMLLHTAEKDPHKTVRQGASDALNCRQIGPRARRPRSEVRRSRTKSQTQAKP